MYASVHCCVCVCRHLGSQLAEMESAIEKMMESDLVEYAMEDIRHRLTHQEDNDANESEVMHHL